MRPGRIARPEMARRIEVVTYRNHPDGPGEEWKAMGIVRLGRAWQNCGDALRRMVG